VTPLAEARRVGVRYVSGHSATRALHDVDFAIRPGEAVSLWGRSGSGKTTLLHVLGGLVAPTEGAVCWRGAPHASLDAAARGEVRRHGIAFVFQGAHLLPYFSAFENVAFAMQDSQSRYAPAQLLELVGLAGKLDSLPSELSGGEAQRVAIARALAQQPELLLCDEPTGQLDTATGEKVLDLIDALRAEFGFALVVASHDTDVAARYDRIVQLADGAIVPLGLAA
jgi:ABC-type lipoprotein export system ATPase subunit